MLHFIENILKLQKGFSVNYPISLILGTNVYDNLLINAVISLKNENKYKNK